MATTAIPGIYPPVRFGDRLLADGGPAEDPPLGTAVERGATTVYLFPMGWPPECDLYVLPSPPITGLHPLSPASARQLIDDAARMTREWLPNATTWRPPDGDD